MKSLFLVCLLLLQGCARLGYLTEQGIQQVKIQWHGKANELVLEDPKISQDKKNKIILVGEYKKFFYHFFNEKPTGIYSKTTMLDEEAVSYLVIASPHAKIEAHQFHFPFFGEFPYIGFFKLDAAQAFAKNLRERENLVTWIRPVYAYSTLGYLEDRILSSFFEYDDVELAELVFHELFHTILFIKDEVELNENLANLYGRELLKEYFKGRDELASFMRVREKKEELSKFIVSLISILQGEFAKLGGFLTDSKADELTNRFVEEVFKPEIRAYCERNGIDPENCKFKDPYNQARFAAFLTYEEEQDFLEKLMLQQKLSLKDFLTWIKQQYEFHKKQKKFETFTDYLKAKTDETTAVN